ncbi:YncE family protein [Proteiniborus sp. MB09-C3]|uniref:YncE family protein n=1 Tax=Proteiniborus sp. MB09-C3 TaxID=3050072 RepID=UPI002553448C|nr:YncE family protein [Proteiniborus sp. MB09-C3]WIV11443.1 YncE family protein [Proteiniborus sp. MB09-C3]
MELRGNKLIVANTGSDSISIINIDTYSLLDTIYLSESMKIKDKETSNGPYVGPHHICFKEDNIIYSANSYNNSVYKINITFKKTEDMVFVGSFPSHLVRHNGLIYVTNSDSNSISVIEESAFNVIENIPAGERPHDIKVDKINNRLFISNNNGYSIDIIDLSQNTERKIKLKYNPVHVAIDDDIMFVLSPPSNGMVDSKLIIYSLKEEKEIKVIDVQGVIVDMVITEDKKTAYVTNVEDGYLYEVDLFEYKIRSAYNIGGMPNNIIKKNDELFISDALNNRVVIFNYPKSKIICSLNVGIEPNGLIII